MKDQFFPPPLTIQRPTQLVHVANPAHKKTKSERLLDRLVYFLTNPHINGNRIYLCKNLLHTKYVIWDNQIIFFGEDRLLDHIKSDAYFQTGENMTDSAIKSALRIISGNNGFWLYADKVNRITPIRTISLYKGYFFYFFAPTYSIPSHSYTRYNRYNRCELGTFVSKSFEIIPSSEHSNNLNSLDYSTQYFRSSNILKEIFSKKLNISEDYFLIILTWLIQSIISDNYTLLELVGESKSGKSYTQSVLRDLIDPNTELISPVPKKIKDLEKQTMEGHVMSFDNVEKINDDIQLFMVDLMSINGIRITYPTDSKEYSADIFVRRPIILNSVTPVVTHEKLQSKTLTIELQAPEIKSNDDQVGDFVYSARIEILNLAKAVFNSAFINSSLHFPRCLYRDLYHFSEIGLRLSQLLYSTTNVFEDQLNLLIKEQFMAKLEENLTCYLIFLWAQQHVNTEKKLSPSNWIKELDSYHDNSFGEWQITPKQFGSDIKKFAPVLRDFGIKCDSLGKRGPCIIWNIRTAEKIDLEANFFSAK